MKLVNLFWVLLCCGSIQAQVSQLELLGHWRDPSIIGSAAYNNAFNECWGIWKDGREYAIIGSTYGTHFIDITDPRKPIEVAKVKGGTSGASVIHRDYDDIQCYLYAVCDEGSTSTLQIIDFSDLPNAVKVVYDSDALFTRSHNIYIDIPAAKLYTAAESGMSGRFALGLYDISEPTKPVLLGHYNRFGNISANHVHDVFARNDTAYLNCGYDGFAIMDFSNPVNPKSIYTLGPTEYPHSGYNHSGWLSPDGSKYLMADENHGSPLKLFDMSSKDAIRITSFLGVQKNNDEIPHNPLVSCDYAYVAYYYDGLQVYDIRDVNNPQRVAYYPTCSIPNRRSYEGAWGTYPYFPSGNIAVADMQDGLFVVKGVETPCNVVQSCSTISSTDRKESMGTSVRIYPNPTNQMLQIETSLHVSDAVCVDMLGKKYTVDIPSGQVSVRTVDLQLIPPGSYWFIVTSTSGSFHKQMIHIFP